MSGARSTGARSGAGTGARYTINGRAGQLILVSLHTALALRAAGRAMGEDMGALASHDGLTVEMWFSDDVLAQLLARSTSLDAAILQLCAAARHMEDQAR
jgi:hypothetical protein